MTPSGGSMPNEPVRDLAFDEAEELAVPRVATGNLHADLILHGGFPAQSVNLIMGGPGTGKTIFAQQLAFHHAGGDRPVLYLTTLSEPLAKVVRYLQTFDFFDGAKIGTAVRYEDIGARLAEEGIAALIPAIKEAILRVEPKILVIDSFKAIHDLSDSITEVRRVVHQLGGLLTAYDTTVFLVGEYEGDSSRYPELVVADSIVELTRIMHGMRDERFFRVRKLRGSRYEEGLHAFRLTPSGMDLFPRLVSPRPKEVAEASFERITTGVPGLDAMLAGGLWRGSTTLVGGPVGSGKTTLGLQYVLEGVRLGEPSLYVNFQENPAQIARTLRGFRLDLDDLRDRGLHLLYVSPVELQIDSIIVEIFRLIRDRDIQRVVVDAVGDLAKAARSLDRLYDFLYAFIQHLAGRNVTSLLTYETASALAADESGAEAKFSSMSDTIILLGVELQGRMRRSIRVLKSRGTPHDLDVHELEITEDGLRVLE
jgi:circadian clock protein KaiC